MPHTYTIPHYKRPEHGLLPYLRLKKFSALCNALAYYAKYSPMQIDKLKSTNITDATSTKTHLFGKFLNTLTPCSN